MQLGKGDIPGVILAGGQGQRIGGQKPQVLLAGRPLWQHVAARVGPQVRCLAINGTDEFDGFEAVRDATPGLGPLGGILAAMVWAQGQGASSVLTAAVDTPFLPLDLVARLQASSARITMVETTDGAQGTTAIWDASLAADLEAFLERGGRKVTEWARSQDLALVHFADAVPPPFFNVNTSDDLTRAETWM